MVRRLAPGVDQLAFWAGAKAQTDAPGDGNTASKQITPEAMGELPIVRLGSCAIDDAIDAQNDARGFAT
jgi:hypothetical protein